MFLVLHWLISLKQAVIKNYKVSTRRLEKIAGSFHYGEIGLYNWSSW